MRGKRRTEGQWSWRDWIRAGNGSSDGLYSRRELRKGRGFREVLDGAFGHVKMGDLENSTFALDFGHRLALASCWLFELVEG